MANWHHEQPAIMAITLHHRADIIGCKRTRTMRLEASLGSAGGTAGIKKMRNLARCKSGFLPGGIALFHKGAVVFGVTFVLGNAHKMANRTECRFQFVNHVGKAALVE
ncbi:hypothetical protein V475_11605 [Sphingobium baderi LL03]|nr:hypothetical protein V475_11605 [Sphingobium baderi LL03]